MSGERLPVVLAIGGHDPTGGAGIQADIEAIRARGAWPATLVTALTAQSTHRVLACVPVEPEDLLEQARELLDDLPVDAVKIGLLPDAATVAAVGEILQWLPGRPIVCDPVLRAGTGDALTPDGLVSALVATILPRCALVTPNSPEARVLAGGEAGLDRAAAALLATGAAAVLITGTHEPTPDVVHVLYRPGCPPIVSRWPRLPATFHGSGCTLSAAIAADLARGLDLESAVVAAARYTWSTLEHGIALGRGHRLPLRLANYCAF